MKRSAVFVLAVALSATLCASCSDLSVMPPVLVRPTTQPSVDLVERLVAAAATQGYEIQLVQAHRGRFAAFARYTDEHGRYMVAVECYADGHVAITPVGPRVERHRGQWILPASLREELVQLATTLGEAAREPGLGP